MTNFFPDDLVGAVMRSTHLNLEGQDCGLGSTLSDEAVSDGGAAWLDAYVDATAEVWDSLLFLGAGRFLREFYKDCLDSVEREPARLSGAADEHDYYGGAA